MSRTAKSRCAVCGKTGKLFVCASCKSIAYCGKEHQVEHWKAEHRHYCKFIPGTSVERSAPEKPNPLDPSLSYPQGRTGRSKKEPLAGIIHFKHNKDGTAATRLLKPGKLTPYIMNASPAQQRARGFQRSEYVETPYREEGNKQVKLPNGKYRHIASFSLQELCKLGWDGALYSSESQRGAWVPFVCGYDSDPEHEYEPVNLRRTAAGGTVGLPANEAGIYVDVPTQGVCRLFNRT